MSNRACTIHSVQARVKESPRLWTVTALWAQDHHALRPMAIVVGAYMCYVILALYGLDSE